jgi:hypothetical protein
MVYYTDLYNNSILYDKCIRYLTNDVENSELKLLEGSVGTATLSDYDSDTNKLTAEKLDAYNLIITQALSDYYRKMEANTSEEKLKSDVEKIHNAVYSSLKNINDLGKEFTVSVAVTGEKYKFKDLQAKYTGSEFNYEYLNPEDIVAKRDFTEAYLMAERSQGSVLYRCMKASKGDSTDHYVDGSVPIFICPSVQDVQIAQSNKWVSLSDTFSGAFTRGVVDAGNNIKDIYNNLNNIKSTLVNAISSVAPAIGSKVGNILEHIAKYQPKSLGSIEFNAREEFQKYEGTDLDIPNLTLNGYALDDTGSGNVLKLIKFLTENTMGKVKPTSTLGYYNATNTNGIITKIANVFSKLCDQAGVGSYEPPPGYISPYELAAGKATADIPFSYNVQLTPWFRMTNLLVESVTYQMPNICIMGNDGNRYPMLAFITITLKKGRKLFTEDLDKYYTTTYDTYWR